MTAYSNMASGSGSFDIAPGPATQLAFAPQPPASVASGVQFGVPVRVKDAFWNDILTGIHRVTLSIASGPSRATLTCARGTTQNTSYGTAPFFCSLDKPGTYTLKATSPDFATAAISTSISVSRQISGVVYNQVAAAAYGVVAKACLTDGSGCQSATVASDGSYAITGLGAASYVLTFSGTSGGLDYDGWYTTSKFYPGHFTIDRRAASTLSTAKANVTALTVTLGPGTKINH